MKQTLMAYAVIVGGGMAAYGSTAAYSADLQDFSAIDRQIITREAPKQGGIVLIREEQVQQSANAGAQAMVPAEAAGAIAPDTTRPLTYPAPQNAPAVQMAPVGGASATVQRVNALRAPVPQPAPRFSQGGNQAQGQGLGQGLTPGGAEPIRGHDSFYDIQARLRGSGGATAPDVQQADSGQNITPEQMGQIAPAAGDVLIPAQGVTPAPALSDEGFFEGQRDAGYNQ